MKSSLFASALAAALTAASFGQIQLYLEPIEETVIEEVHWTTYRLYATGFGGFYQLTQVFGTESRPAFIATDEFFYQNQLGGPTSLDIDQNLFDDFPELEWDSYVTIGSLYQDGYPATQNDLYTFGDFNDFETGDILAMNTYGGWFVDISSSQGTLDPCLVAQLTVPSGSRIWGSLNLYLEDNWNWEFPSPLTLFEVTFSSDQGNCQEDADSDGVVDCLDGCPNDPNKTDPGECGCKINCCFSGPCFLIDEESCLANGGQVLQGPCDSSVCSIGGSCCISGTCTVTTVETCFSLGGSFAGNNTDCTTTDCPSSCEGDVSENGTVDFTDILILLNNWGPCSG